MAQQTRRLAPLSALVIEREDAIRERLEAALADERLRGVALFGHGQPHAVMGSDGLEALDAANIRLVGPRWVHAMACLTGIELGPASSFMVHWRGRMRSVASRIPVSAVGLKAVQNGFDMALYTEEPFLDVDIDDV